MIVSATCYADVSARQGFNGDPYLATEEFPLALTQTQLASAVADRAEQSNTDAKRALAAPEEIVPPRMPGSPESSDIRLTPRDPCITERS